VNVWPATVKVPLRAAPVFAATENAVVPEPVPDAPEVITIHPAPDAAVQAHVGAEAVTPTDPEPPVSATFWLDGAMENVHGGGGGGGGAAACVTLNVLPPALIVADRSAPVLDATLNATVPLPVPDAPAVTVNHAAEDEAVQAHVAADAVTLNDPLPAASENAWLAAEIENVHGAGGAAA
jgi:hypothetical protein